MMTPKEVALLAAKALDDKKGQSIKLLKVADVTTLADYFLICTGTSNTHVKTLCDEVEKVLEEHGEAMLRREGHQRFLLTAKEKCQRAAQILSISYLRG